METSRARVGGWIAIGIAVIAMGVGYLLNLWSSIWWYDGAVHAYTTLALALLIGAYLSGVVLTGRTPHPVLYVLSAAALGLAVSAVWELVEWSYDFWLATGNFQKSDTIRDLALDTGGALAGGFLLALLVRD